MSDTLSLPTEPIESASDAVSAPPVASIAIPSDRSSSAAAPVVAPAPTDMHALLALITSALAADADDATRASARDVWAQLAGPLANAVSAPPVAPVAPSPIAPSPIAPSMPMLPLVPPPSSPIVVAARALRGLPPEQLLDIVLQRLRGALPAGTTVAAPKGIQFQLVPVTRPSSGSR
jgi:hypothetical protein